MLIPTCTRVAASSLEYLAAAIVMPLELSGDADLRTALNWMSVAEEASESRR